MKSVPAIEAADARALIDLAIDAATAMGVPQNIAVVDAGGALLAFHRMDGAKPFTADFAIAKARTAAGLHAATDKLGEVALPGQRGYGLNTLCGGDVAILGGGVPVTVAGTVVGAIGISSGSVHQDAEVANRAAEGFQAYAHQAQATGPA